MSKQPLVNEGEALYHIAHFKESAEVGVEIAAHESNIEDDRLYEIEVVPRTTDN